MTAPRLDNTEREKLVALAKLVTTPAIDLAQHYRRELRDEVVRVVKGARG